MIELALLVVALALPTAVAWVLLGLALAGGARTAVGLAERAALAIVVGQGAASFLAFAWLLVGGALDGARYVVAEAAAFAAIGAGAVLAARRPRAAARQGGAQAPPPPRALDALALLTAALALVAALAAFVALSRSAPHGAWDAWAIWNLRARFLLRGGAEWRGAFVPELAWSQTGYPLLLPLAVARAWAWAGESVVAPAAIAALFTLAAPLALGAAVARGAGAVAGAVAAALLVATPRFLDLGAAQYADVPLAAILVGALGLLARARDGEAGPARAASLMLAGLLLGLAGWTKNEGLAAACAAALAHLALPGEGGRRRALRDLAPVAVGAALPAAAWLVFHGAVASAVAPALAQADAQMVWQKLLDGARWRAVLAGLWQARPGAAHHVGLAAIALALLLGARPLAVLRSPALLVAALLTGAYALVYVTTPQDLAWHLDNSAERVLLHVWPALLLGLFAASPPPHASAAPAAPSSRSRPCS